MDFKKVKSEKGITLIALAVTIVVLLILAGVTISSVFSENGIIERAKKAQKTINEAQKNDLAELEKLAEQMEKYTNSNDTVGVDLSEYATLDLLSYTGRKIKQKCDYIQMYIEISDSENEEDKITYAIGNDWEDNIVKENDNVNKLFLKSTSELKLLNIQEHDVFYFNYYDDEGENIIGKCRTRVLMTNGFTDAKLSGLYLKKGKNYNIKISTKASKRQNGEIVSYMLEIYNGETGVVEDNVNIELSPKTICSKMIKLIDVDGNGMYNTVDTALMQNYITKGDLTTYYYYSTSGYKAAKQLINAEGGCINEEAENYLEFDIDRNGYIDEEDTMYLDRAMGSSSGIF